MIPHNRPTLDHEESTAATKVLGSGWLAQGSEVAAFEEALCTYLELPAGHAVAVSSGTAALYLALWALQGKHQRVGIPVYACAALRNAVRMLGAEPILLDVARDQPNVNVEQIMQSQLDIAIVPHMFGLPAEIGKITGVKVIEDCAQALGATINRNQVGCLGDVGIFSFYATKLITSAGQGGMVVATDKNLIDSIRDYREFDCRDDSKARFNFQMTDLQAAIGRVQLAKLPRLLARREEIFNTYKAAGIPLMETVNPHAVPVRYRAVMRTDAPQKWQESLLQAGIKTIVPIEEWELLSDDGSQFDNAHALARSTLSLPLYPSLTDSEVTTIVNEVVEL